MARKSPVHQRIRVLRKAKGLTQVQLAALVGVHKTAVWHWEADQLPGWEHLPELAAALGVTVTELIRGDRTYAAMRRVLEAA